MGALLYLLNPFDLIPDHIPVVGYLDDLGVMTLAIGEIVRRERRFKGKPVAEAES